MKKKKKKKKKKERKKERKVFCVAVSCNVQLVTYQCFGGKYYLRLQGALIPTQRTTRCRKPNDHNFRIYSFLPTTFMTL